MEIVAAYLLAGFESHRRVFNVWTLRVRLWQQVISIPTLARSRRKKSTKKYFMVFRDDPENGSANEPVHLKRWFNCFQNSVSNAVKYTVINYREMKFHSVKCRRKVFFHYE